MNNEWKNNEYDPEHGILPGGEEFADGNNCGGQQHRNSNCNDQQETSYQNSHRNQYQQSQRNQYQQSQRNEYQNGGSREDGCGCDPCGCDPCDCPDDE